LGEVRKKELVKSALQLGVGSRDDILLIEDKYNILWPIDPYDIDTSTGTSQTQ
jgi:hypothetical protein